MTEEEWLTCEEPVSMLEWLGERKQVRKRRLFACACCWRLNNILTDKARNAVALAELFADGSVTDLELRLAWRAVGFPKAPARSAAAMAARAASCSPGYDGTVDAAGSAVSTAVCRGQPAEADQIIAEERAIQSDFVRDIFGNPFRPITFDPAWQSEIVVGLARGIYEDRAFERMPILADALEEAGCDNPDVLAHCREPGDHVRGCWVVDLVLGKS